MSKRLQLLSIIGIIMVVLGAWMLIAAATAHFVIKYW